MSERSNPGAETKENTLTAPQLRAQAAEWRRLVRDGKSLVATMHSWDASTYERLADALDELALVRSSVPVRASGEPQTPEYCKDCRHCQLQRQLAQSEREIRTHQEPDSAEWWRSIAQRLGVEIHDLRKVLGEADRDLHEWLRFARRQMAEMPDWEHTSYGPTSSGVAETENVRRKIREVFQRAAASDDGSARQPQEPSVPVQPAAGDVGELLRFIERECHQVSVNNGWGQGRAKGLADRILEALRSASLRKTAKQDGDGARWVRKLLQFTIHSSACSQVHLLDDGCCCGLHDLEVQARAWLDALSAIASSPAPKAIT